MDKKSTHELLLANALERLQRETPNKYLLILEEFIASYREALGDLFDAAIPDLLLFLELTAIQFKTPYSFEPYHKKIRHPIDYYRFSLDFIRPLIDLANSSIFGPEHLDTIAKKLGRGENVVLLANHQTEPDPQAIAILLENGHPDIAEKIIYVAGARVITDPLAIPFSLGCDLICIYSKRYIDDPPELKAAKQMHNKATMEQTSRLLKEGGKIIYVAPSGGRDRRNSEGEIELAPFDAASIEMFYLMAKKAKTPTSFIPFALSTYDLLPPPESIQKDLGEMRKAKRTPISIAFGAPFDMENFPGSESVDRLERREKRAENIWGLVNQMYQQMATR
jgi:glycerol-3-phosphate O-acyltransferase